ncbi:MAG: hypothetical protein COV31_00940 [Candidatus Yanofskybacteria bacterium CG10_big_fil_rev_8_21_14_0_10_46_23]|uniref:AAA+ ATPase domain-containing protein n=1 Tax=Candidatus Yanofskybacteria bacterium CG10_big_fil_rev_8_21_14_0_10_46_23 TaxID=1975098 RepID=A0A2H0R4I4_9BACT|nr:MAG: hypothetical protein COV31_00940 [Candidatus Yanofskybacteria bacterium CG10_big_fil_rev_8_21_14_0_10_46_23]
MWATFGFEAIKRDLGNQFKRDDLNQAYFFHGQEMIGKKTLGFELIRKVNKIEDILQHPDFFLISSEENDSNLIHIDQVRNLRKFLALKPHSSQYRFVLIDEAHEMTLESGNAILKILEEPPSPAIFIVVSSRPDLVLKTIVSRCQSVYFPPHSEKTMTTYLNSLEALSESQKKFLSQFSNGRIGLIQSLYERNDFDKIKKAVADLREIISAPIYRRLDLIDLILKEKRGYQPMEAIIYWLLYLRTFTNRKKNSIVNNILKLSQDLDNPALNQRLLFEEAFISF